MTNSAWNTMNRLNETENDRLARGIRRQIGAETTTRFLRSLPLFRTAEAVPDHFRDMLSRLDEQERSGGRSRR